MSRGLRVGIACVAVVALAAPGAHAAKRVGSGLSAVPDKALCQQPAAPPTHTCTYAIAGLAAADAAEFGAIVPSPGIVTSWRIRRGAGSPVQTALRVIRGGAGAGTSAEVTLPSAAGTYEFTTRLAVGAGDRIGVDLRNVPAGQGVTIARSPAPAADLLTEWIPAIPDGASPPPYAEDPYAEPDSGVQLLVNADVEPDADGDGFGDETQDACPQIATTQLDCAIGAPQTTIRKKPKRKTTKRKVSIPFVSNVPGATFQCSLDSVAYKPCTSPLRLKRLKVGKHIVLIRAIFNQIPDPTPARAKFTVVKKKKRR
jgi:hypothetical protein